MSERPVIKRPEEQAISMRGQLFFLLAGLLPLVMLLQFWAGSGTGLNPSLVGFALLYAGAALVALNYFNFYRTHKPRSALIPPGPGKAVLVALVLIPLGVFNMMGTVSGVSFTLSPGPRIASGQLAPTVAKVLLMKPVEAPPRRKLDLRAKSWLTAGHYLRGSLWGALGYAVAFALMGALFGFMRKEVVDPRDHHVGTGLRGAMVRGCLGLFYGGSMGFLLGATLIFVLRMMFGSYVGLSPALLHWVYVLGAASHPNVAFTYAFSTASMLAGALALFWGARDFTAPISDPKAPELTRPVSFAVPGIPPAPAVQFDMGRIRTESEQILGQFTSELGRLFSNATWEYERYELPPLGKAAAREPMSEAVHVISARDGHDEAAAPSAMGALGSVYVQITAELGTLSIPAADWLTLAEGAMLELPKAADGALVVRINGKPAGKGRPLTVNGNKAVKVTQLKGTLEQLVGNAGGLPGNGA